MSDLATIASRVAPMLPQIVETASSAMAAQAKAMVEARYVIAMQRPRNWDQVRQDVLRECRRPSFADNKSAYYIKPIGNGVEGLGIRFVEVALRCMTNVLIESSLIFEDDAKEIHRVTVTDLEANTTYPLDIKVRKTVERSKPADDGSYISVRTNSYGKMTYTVPAQDDDLLNKRAALISKAIRTLGLRVIPGDIQDEAEAIIKLVRKDQAAADPDAERKKIADAFASIGVKAQQLTEYLGHALDTCSPDEIVRLRGIFGAIKDGEATWKTVMENRAEMQGAESVTESVTEASKTSKPQMGRKAGKSMADIGGHKITDPHTGEIRQDAASPESPSPTLRPDMPSAAEPQPTASPGPSTISGLSESQERILIIRAKSAGYDVAALLQKFGSIDLSNLNAVLAKLKAEIDAQS